MFSATVLPQNPHTSRPTRAPTPILEPTEEDEGRGHAAFTLAADGSRDVRNLEVFSAPDTLQCDDPPTQSQLLQRMLEDGIIQNSTAGAYNAKPVKNLYLSTLKNLWARQNRRVALQLLQQKNRLVIDDKYKIPPNHKDLLWVMNKVRLSKVSPHLNPLLILCAHPGLSRLQDGPFSRNRPGRGAPQHA